VSDTDLKMFGSLRTRLALSNLLVTLVGLLVLTLVFAQVLLQHSEEIKRNDVGQQAVQLRSDVSTALEKFLNRTTGGSVLSFNAYLSHDSRILDKRIVLFNARGMCFFDSAVFQHQRQSGSGAPVPCTASSSVWLDRAAMVEHESVSHFVKRGPQTYLAYQEPIRITVGIGAERVAGVGAVILIARASNIVPAWTTLGGVFLIAAVAAGIIWLLLGLYFAYSISRPLARITEAARAMAAGNYDQRVDVDGRGEIGELAQSFNHMAATVKASHQLLKDFVANVSHDLRTPLTIISGYAATVLDGTARTQEEVCEAVQIIAEEAAHMQRLVDDLLQLTRLESGLRQFDRQPVSLRALADRTIRRATALHNGRVVCNDIPPDLPLAYVDEELIERALMNLLDNALEHTPEGSQVTVSALADRNWITVSVSDTGTGIPASELERIFERLYRADRGRSRNNGHSGLGLPIVKEIVEAHNGMVSVESQVGRGSTFRFTIPRFEG
jgi:signal transduction histidine kinase